VRAKLSIKASSLLGIRPDLLDAAKCDATKLGADAGEVDQIGRQRGPRDPKAHWRRSSPLSIEIEEL